MFSVTAILLVFAVLQGSVRVFGDPLRSARGRINSGLEGWQQAHCEQLRRLSSNVQFPWYCKPGQISVISVGFKHAGQDLWYNVRNQLSYTGLVSRMSDVEFITEQDGTGDIQAKFNGYILSCQGLPANKRKLCTIPRSRGPWGGTITVQIIGSPVSTFFRMAGKPVCPNPGLQGYNCDQDINECVVHKDKQLCAWKDGCVNTYGGYKCKCPPGYKVSSQDFRLCEKGKRKSEEEDILKLLNKVVSP